MSDGSEQAEYYPTVVHAFNKETQTYDDINNDLTVEEDGRHYINGTNTFVAKFSREDTNDELFSIQKDTFKVTAFAKKTKKDPGHGVEPKKQRSSCDPEGIINKDILLYENVMSGADFEYYVNSEGIKENIIVKNKNKLYRYSFILECDNLIVTLIEDERRVIFCDCDGLEVFNIPAPFMKDALGNISHEVYYTLKTAAGGKYVLDVVADSEWINSPKREFPVIIDPQIDISRYHNIETYSWKCGCMTDEARHVVGTTGEGDGACNASRMYINMKMPVLPNNPRIKKAEITFYQYDGVSECGDNPLMGLYHVYDELSSGEVSSAFDNSIPIDYARMKTGRSENGEKISYTFDITSLIDRIVSNDTFYPNLVLKMIDETYTNINTVTLYSGDFTDYSPRLRITYETSYGVNTDYRSHSHDLGRFGIGSVDLQRGNLMFESEDFAWGGNRMPVTIKHLYNSALNEYQYTTNEDIGLNAAMFFDMNIGKGWKLNIMQGMIPLDFQHEGNMYSGYAYIGENGEETYFIESTVEEKTSDGCTYKLYEDIDGKGMIYDPEKRILEFDGLKYTFNSIGRLVSIMDDHRNSMIITYTSHRITSVTDGAGRDFVFTYGSSDKLTAITAPDGSTISYGYGNDRLMGIIYPDGRGVDIVYSASGPTAVTLSDDNANETYKIEYVYSNNRVSTIKEYGVENGEFVLGTTVGYSYYESTGRTLVTTTEQPDTDEGEISVKRVRTVYTFDDDGNIVSQYAYSSDTDKHAVSESENGLNPFASGSAGVVSNINNLLYNHSFDGGMSNWYYNNCDMFCATASKAEGTPYGEYAILMEATQAGNCENGVYHSAISLPAGKYSFSCYVMTPNIITGSGDEGVYLRVTDASGNILGESEHLRTTVKKYIRLVTPFELSSAKDVTVHILMYGSGTVYANAPQLENNPYANAYNMLVNGNFENGLTGWKKEGIVRVDSATSFNMSKSLQIFSDLSNMAYARQSVKVKSAAGTRETFTLSGWAKGEGIVKHEREGCYLPQFRLRAVILYTDNTSETYTADFSPCTEDWQFASVQFAKSKCMSVDSIRVYCDYSYNVDVAHFDNIQLTRDNVETGLTYLDFPEYSNTETAAGSETASDADVFTELVDKYGNNLTETVFTDGEFGTIYRSFGYTSDCNGAENAGNDLISETDARGNVTTYTVDEETSRNTEVTDRMGNVTRYTYDDAGRVSAVRNNTSDGTNVSRVFYYYDTFDNLTEIIRGDVMTYLLGYNAFHKLESIAYEGAETPLVKYAYKNGNGSLKSVTYANGHTMKVTYNSFGQITAEKWYDANNALAAHYKYVYDGAGNIVRSIDMIAEKEYNYTYESGRIVRATESDITISGDIVTSKTIVNSILYTYDNEGRLTRKGYVPAIGSQINYYYEYPENSNTPVVKIYQSGAPVQSHSKTDSFGRKVFDELQTGTAFVSRQFSYHAGEETAEHADNGKLKSTPTTMLVSQIVLSDGRTLSYEYDVEERITKVTDSLEGVTEYTYDTQGQLTSETKNGVTVNITYDNYGNIRTKGSHTYSYDHDNWKDLLTKYDGQSITYDAQGNPTTYLGHALTWSKGRQLDTYDNNTYTYNASGIRTSKTVCGEKHTYALDGVKIVRETWGSNTLSPLYDNEEGVCGIAYNEVPYYFIKNLQGDVIAIVNRDGDTVARYSYDAWGKCSITLDNSGVGIATINPYRYRSYYYDNDTGLYYLQSRYYDPEVGRFINADDVETAINSNILLSHNLFSYCFNSPVNMSDIYGYIPVWVVYAAAGAALFGGVTYVIGKALGIEGWALAALTASLAAVGATIAAILGVKFLARISPKLAEWANKVAKNTKIIKPSYKHTTGEVTNLGGIILFDAFKIMLHPPHHNQHNYFHIQIEVKLPGVKMPWTKFRIKINPQKWI